MDKTALLFVAFSLTLLQVICEGFDFTLDDQSSAPSTTENSRSACAVLRCTENLTLSRSESGADSRKVIALAVYRKQPALADAKGNWEKVISITRGSPTQNRVSDGVRIKGQLSEKEAEITLELFKQRDCRFTEFSCVVELEGSEGRKSVKRSLAGYAVASESLAAFRVEDARVRRPAPGGNQPQSLGTLAPVLSSLGLKLDLIESGLVDSLRDLENRLEDKVSNLQAAITDKVSELTSKVDDKIERSESKISEKIEKLENRLEDKLSHLDSDAVPRRNVDSSDRSGTGAINKDISDQLAAIGSSVRSIEKNFSNFDDVIIKVKDAASQCASSRTAEGNDLSSLTSIVTSLTSVTENLSTRVNDFKDMYAGGALVPVEEFFDPLRTGKKEWRLAFRGTPYINVKIYPAYIHGTGIPREVEEGCKQFNSSLPCTNHYRNHLALADWKNIDEVLFAIFKDDKVVKHVVFNARGATYTSWFAEGRVILSSWTDLATQSHNFFSLEGETNPVYLRRFLINHDYNKGCNGFRGWFYAADALPGGCAADKAAAHPKFQYASGETFAVWTSSNVALADAIGVFLKYE